MDKYLNKFINLFSFLDFAANYLEEPEAPYLKKEYDNFIEYMKSLAIEMTQSPAQSEKFLFKDLKKEIKDNLYSLTHDKDVYVKDIIRKFVDISRYLDISAKEEYSNPESINPETIYYFSDRDVQSDSSLFTLKLISKYNQKKFPIQDYSVEQYVLVCFEALKAFSIHLDALCISFGLKLPQLQDQLGIYIFKQRNIQKLIDLGYENELKTSFEYEQFVQNNRTAFLSLKHKSSKVLLRDCKTIQTVKSTERLFRVCL
jgi:hypothetical protein